MKTFIFTQIYINEEKNDILNILNHQEIENVEYKYIDIIVSNEKKIVDFNVIQKFLNINQLKTGLAEEIYNGIDKLDQYVAKAKNSNKTAKVIEEIYEKV